eukprot:GFYU01026042.1.p1 GENE.GFYU01026042.1~~GFYU01026042.1.p1  ORF type:complete len:208 (-),score=31.59 GFYU01026042.1:271-894(-)
MKLQGQKATALSQAEQAARVSKAVAYVAAAATVVAVLLQLKSWTLTGEKLTIQSSVKLVSTALSGAGAIYDSFMLYGAKERLFGDGSMTRMSKFFTKLMIVSSILDTSLHAWDLIENWHKMSHTERGIGLAGGSLSALSAVAGVLLLKGKATAATGLGAAVMVAGVALAITAHCLQEDALTPQEQYVEDWKKWSGQLVKKYDVELPK